MNKLLFFLWMPFLIGCIGSKRITPAFTGSEIGTGQIKANEIALISKTLAAFPNHSEMAIAIIHENETAFYGIKRVNDTLQLSDNSSSIFEIGSISKVFTTHLLANALNDNLIKSLDEPLEEYLEFTINGSPPINFLQLANHTSGLPGNLTGNILNTDVYNPYKGWDEEKFREYLEKKVKMESVQGEKYVYSNVGISLLAHVICRAREKDYETLLQEEIFKPLDMQYSTSKRALVTEKLVQGYNWKGKPTVNWDLAAMEGAGAILSSVQDLSKYLIWNFTALNSSLLPMRQKTHTINDDMEIALGWHIIKNKSAQPYLWHNGGTGGYKSSMGINLSNNSGVIILSNIGATNNPQKGLIDKLCFDLMKTSGSNFSFAQQELPVNRDTIHFTLSAFNNIIVKTVVNGNDTLDLKFDSGTTGLLLTNYAIDNKLHWTRNSNHDNSLKIGNLVWDSLRIYPVELSGQGTDGRFGWDLFNGKVVEIDFDNSLFIVHSEPPTIDEEYARFDIEYTHTLFCIQAELEVKGIKYKNRFLFDNGYQRTVMLDTVLMAEQNFPKDLEVIKKVIMRNGQGKEIPVITVNCEKIHFGNYSLSNIPVQLLTTGNPAKFQTHILGNEVLKRFNTFLDFQNNNVYLKPNSLIKQGYKDEK